MRERWNSLLALVMALAFLPATAAYAHYVYEGSDFPGDGSGYTWENGLKCVQAYSEISHGTGGGYAKAIATMWKEQTVFWTDPNGNTGTKTIACNQRWRRAVNYIATNNDLYYYTKVNGKYKWVLCTAGPWKYNSSSDSQWTYERYYGANADCGPAYYGNNAASFTIFNSQWVGGGLWSGYHWLSSADKVQTSSQSQRMTYHAPVTDQDATVEYANETVAGAGDTAWNVAGDANGAGGKVSPVQYPGVPYPEES